MAHLFSMVKELVRPFVPVMVKRHHEMKYWETKKKTEGELGNDHYEQFYTSHFGFESSFYKDKVIMDIGCGPRGSLEWAEMASRRIGLDPLADKYLELGADKHQMEYISSPSENIPLPDSACDAVFSFNSFDHVDNLHDTADELKRVTRPGGFFLLLVEVNHPPTVCEPHGLTPRMILDLLEPEFKPEEVKVFASTVEHDIYASIKGGVLVEGSPESTSEIGFLSAKFVRQAIV